MLFSRSLLFMHFKYNSVYKSISNSLPVSTPLPHPTPQPAVSLKKRNLGALLTTSGLELLDSK